MTIAASLARRWRLKNQKGTAAIEFALFVPVLVIFLTEVAELGFGLYQASCVYDAVEAGMLYASKNSFDAKGIASAITNATSLAGIQASPFPSQFCGCPSAKGISTIACASTCADGTTPSQYIQVNALLTRKSITPFPGLGLPSTLTAKALVRSN